MSARNTMRDPTTESSYCDDRLTVGNEHQGGLTFEEFMAEPKQKANRAWGSGIAFARRAFEVGEAGAQARIAELEGDNLLLHEALAEALTNYTNRERELAVAKLALRLACERRVRDLYHNRTYCLVVAFAEKEAAYYIEQAKKESD